MKAVTVQLSDDAYTQLVEYKKKHGGVPLAVIVRQAIICFFTSKYANKHNSTATNKEA